MSFTSKLPHVGTTIFTVMSQMAQEYKALNLSQGFPNFEASPELIRFTSEAMKNGYNQYAPMAGALPLREQIAIKTEKLYGKNYDVDAEITVTAGATQAIFTIITAFLKKDDEVIIFKPAYDCYEPAIELVGAKSVAIQLESPFFSVDWEAVKNAITPNTKMMIINSPHNPSGTIWSAGDMQQLSDLLEGTNILLLSDEVYEHIIFDGEQHQSAGMFPKLAERAFIVSSFGKTFHITGWKLGYVVAPKELMVEFRKVHQFNVFSVHSPSQIGLAEYLKNEDNYLCLNGFYQQKRDLFLEALKESRFKITPTQGTFFQLLEYQDISLENDVDFSKRLVKEFGIASIPISVFNTKEADMNVLRFCFAKTDETLLKAAELLCKI
ncbi:MAG: methionine aminotransferase [Flavobacteriaceae bacterium]|nr:MAG: methionine aminotransferase [Flavobacteriaceae bacterium]